LWRAEALRYFRRQEAAMVADLLEREVLGK
jgi:hypothetical protein